MTEPPRATQPAVLSCAILAERLRVRLAGMLTDKQLAAWAFDRFYALEQETLHCQPGVEDLITSTLDELMFADEPGFALAEPDLQILLARLEAA